MTRRTMTIVVILVVFAVTSASLAQRWRRGRDRDWAIIGAGVREAGKVN